MPSGVADRVIIIGQYKAIVKQYTFSPKHWQGRMGESTLLPKDEGLGLMLSAFQCWEHGFGFQNSITQEILNKVNKSHEGKTYSDMAAAVSLGIKNGEKQELTLLDNPFLKLFEYEANFERYWTYKKMVIQLEDCVDIMKVLHPNSKFVFLFDHSCGHDWQREDGLNPRRVSKYFGGAQPIMRPSTISHKEGFLGI